MYNQDVIDRLNNLTNLYALKNANVKVISKKNEFGDIVKFFAQINTNNVIQRITYKASGCTTFLALCSYFCEIAEGKTIDKALKISEKDLEKFSKLDENRTHVYKIILDTFAMLIKKYNIGIKKGTIVPCEPSEITQNVKVDMPKTSKKSEPKVIIEDNYIIDTPKTKSKKEKKVTENKKELKSEKVEEIDVSQNKTSLKPLSNSREPKINKTIVKKETKVVNLPEINTVKVETTKVQVTTSNTKDVDVDAKLVAEKHKKALEQAKILQRSAEIAKDQSEKEKEKTVANNMKMSHINALTDKIKNKETNEKMKSNSENLSNLLNKFKIANNTTNAKTNETNDKIETESISKKNIVDKKEKSTKEEKKAQKKQEKEIKDLTEESKKKKSLFSWFKK